MRVPTITTYSSSTYRLGNLTRDLKDANEVISTQKRINEISDDPIGMSQVLSLKGSIDHLDQINSNVVMGKSWLESGENALDSVNSLVLEAKTEVTRLVNASMSARERRDAIQMIDHTIDQLMTLGNTQINGNYIFSGTDTDTKPLSFSKDATEEKVLYNGNHTPFAVRTDRNSGVDVGRDGKETFWDSAVEINSTNNTIVFKEDNGHGITSEKVIEAVIPDGTYTVDKLENAVEKALNEASAEEGYSAVYQVKYDENDKTFSIEQDGTYEGYLKTEFMWENGGEAYIDNVKAPFANHPDDVKVEVANRDALTISTPEPEGSDPFTLTWQGDDTWEVSNNPGYPILPPTISGTDRSVGINLNESGTADINITLEDPVTEIGQSIEFDIVSAKGDHSTADEIGFSKGNAVYEPPTSDEPAEDTPISITSLNNKIDFREVTTDNAGNRDVCELTAVVEPKPNPSNPSSSYTSHEELALEVEKALEKASNEEGNRINYAVSWDEFTGKFTIKEKGTGLDEFHLDWKSGPNAPLSVGGNGESIGEILGFDPEDDVAKAAESDRKAEWGIFNTLIDLKSYLADNDTYGIERSLGRLEAHYQNMTQRIVDSGMKYSRLETRETITSEVSLSLTERRSSIEDADMIESIMKLKNVQTAYQAALNSTSQIMNLSLVGLSEIGTKSMLVLARKPGEKIQIGNDIVVSILEVEGGSVKLGIEAPKDVSILRMEVFEKIIKENIEAASRPFDEISEALDMVKKKLPKE